MALGWWEWCGLENPALHWTQEENPSKDKSGEEGGL